MLFFFFYLSISILKSSPFPWPRHASLPSGALGYVKMRVPSGGGVVELLARRDMLLTYCVVKEPGLGGLNEGQALHFSFLTWQPFRETLLSAIS